MGTLTTKGRKHIKPSNFALPGKRYPIHDMAHARNALARVNQHGTPDEIKKVTAAVYRKYPAMKNRAKEAGKLSEKAANVISKKELAMGIKREMEHTDDPVVAKQIAMDHLKENPSYYSRLKDAKLASVMASETKILRDFFKLQPIQLSGDNVGPGPAATKPDVQVLRVGKFDHPKYGHFEITPKILAELKNNFDNRVRGVDVAFDYFHDSDKEASGWPTELYLKENGTELWAKVDWTPVACKKLAERELRYFSPDFAFEWKDPETGVVYKNVLFGGGLTNRPFVKEMAAIVASEQKGENMSKVLTLEELQEKVLALAEENKDMKKKLEEMKEPEGDEPEQGEPEPEEGEDDGEDDGEMEPGMMKKHLLAYKKKLADYAEKHKKLADEMAEMKEAKKLAEKVTAFNVLLSEGKACAAQKTAFLKGDMVEFAKNARSVNLSEKGSTYTLGEGDVEDREDKVLKLAEKIAKEDKIDIVDAITLANKRIVR